MTSGTTSDPATFHCPNPNFTIKALPSGTIFRVRKYRLTSGSNVFADMFGVCGDSDDEGEVEGREQEVEIHESPQLFEIFLRILHDDVEGIRDEPSSVEISAMEDGNDETEDPSFTPPNETKPTQVQTKPLPPLIPLPVLRRLFDLGDKYDVTPPITKVLESHLLRNGPDHPLEVYAYAWSLGLPYVANKTSAYLLTPPLHTYTMEEISQLPSVEAYHRLTLLHGHRVQRLQAVLKAEEIFPHGYLKCDKHGDDAIRLWETRKANVSRAITPGSDVAMEMGNLMGSFGKCESCRKGCERAIAMLKYKCDKVAWTIDRVPIRQ